MRKVITEYLHKVEDTPMNLLLKLFRSLLNVTHLDLIVILPTSVYICLLNKAIRSRK